jgi:hypothetical protein
LTTRGTALVVQPFIKPDTLEALLRSLLRCAYREAVRLVFFSDNPSGLAAATHPASGGRELEFADKNRRVMALVHEFRGAHARDFREIVVQIADSHLGPCRTCRTAVDFAFESDDLVILTEDDALFSEDAIEWYQRIHDHGVMDVPENWAVTGEAIYFDAKTIRPPAEYVARARAACIRRRYFHQYTRFKYLPATSFAVVKPKWELFRELRGEDRGDEKVCQVLRERKKFVVFPILSRVTNVNMLHEDGYSVAMLGADRVAAIGTFDTYLTSGDVIGEVDRSVPFFRFAGSWDKLHDESVKLLGFDETE